MRNLEITSKLPLAKAAQKVRDFFGPGGLGLALKQDGDLCLTFAGGGGYVRATFCQEGGHTKIGLVTQEWERQVDELAANLK